MERMTLPVCGRGVQLKPGRKGCGAARAATGCVIRSVHAGPLVWTYIFWLAHSLPTDLPRVAARTAPQPFRLPCRRPAQIGHGKNGEWKVAAHPPLSERT